MGPHHEDPGSEARHKLGKEEGYKGDCIMNMRRTTLVESHRISRQPRNIGAELSFIAREQERIEQERKISTDLVQHVEDDRRMSYEQYLAVFDPCGLYV